MKIVGIDEVGRGCLAGPIVAAAVVLDRPIIGLKDSKLLSKKQREELAVEIYGSALSIGIGWSNASTINKYRLSESVKRAMKMAVSTIDIRNKTIVIDGNYNYLSELPNVSILIGADNLIPEVSAASIIAKVYRDQWMSRMALKYPNYGFEKHVGYGTKFHLERIKEFGPCIQHRMFYKPLNQYSTH